MFLISHLDLGSFGIGVGAGIAIGALILYAIAFLFVAAEPRK